ncbi:MAG: nucleotidyl transferase AbiEii/AbiGii toxin family protein [Phycisphaerae bacterium]|nr:nucleotidyl transferase AbiEii/AbiGii toxin family protein [Phycisphaerae bacterium]
MMEKEQALLAKVLDLFSQKFDKRAVLRGGMVLRVLGSPRLTNDLDYVFVPYRSKKDIVADVLECLKAVEGATLTHSLNSKCLRVVLSTEDATIQIEAKVAMKIPTSTLSTKLFSTQFNVPQRLIRVVDYSVALADKMAAWNERRLIRDLYDIWFFIQMNIEPDVTVLKKRLKKPMYSKDVREKDYFSGNTVSEFYEFLRKKASLLSDEAISKALSDYLPPEETTGLTMLFRAALAKLR